MPWHSCEVVRTGPAEDGVVYVMLRDVGGAFPARWFKAEDRIKREMLATALAAMSTGYRVEALLTSVVEYSARKPGGALDAARERSRASRNFCLRRRPGR